MFHPPYARSYCLHHADSVHPNHKLRGLVVVHDAMVYVDTLHAGVSWFRIMVVTPTYNMSTYTTASCTETSPLSQKEATQVIQ